MNSTRIRTVARRIAGPPPDPGPPQSDADLLARFLDAHDESAFEGLVARHLPALRAVCRSLLRNPHDADDAVQATFLVLVRRAGAVRNRLALGAWLCRVAWRTANRLREENARRGERHAAGLDPDATPGRDAPHPTRDESAEVLDEEIRRLPECYRLAVLVCYAAGTSTAEAAARLGWPKGTLLTRLAWARRRLRDRLTKRGVTLGGAFTAAFAGRVGSAGGSTVAGRITAAAAAVASGSPVAKELVSERVSSLTEGVVRTMVGTKIKIAVGIGFLVVALLGIGLGRMTAGPADAGEKKAAPTAALPKGADAKAPAANPAGEPEPHKADPAAPAGPGNDLVVRRPHGAYSREVPGYGRVTVRFNDGRMHVVANVSIDGASLTIEADADYSINRESVIFGIVTSVDVTVPRGVDEGAAGEIALLASAANDMPFAFRVRADDDAVVIKDFRFGAFGSPSFEMLLEGLGDGEDLMVVTGLLSGKYKLDPNPERNVPPPAPRANPPARPPKKRSSSS